MKKAVIVSVAIAGACALCLLLPFLVLAFSNIGLGAYPLLSTPLTPDPALSLFPIRRQ